jgi:iron complex outermembrane receptor protein
MNCAIEPVPLKFFSLLLLLVVYQITGAQDSIPSNTLSSVEVRAYGQVRRLKDVPAAVGYVGTQTLDRFGQSSVVMAVNTVPGVRMEERSPGSYRINIRGSSLRSPFGVRNVKVYYNDLPFTDPGGQTYLNGLGYYNFGSIEILKGPGSSLYGAGTGGVLLIESLGADERASVMGEYSIGSYGLRNAYASVTTGEAESQNRIGFQRQEAEGYRYHSALKRDVLSWTGRYRIGETQALKTTFLYSRHFYETPGALTRAEILADPRRSRPAGGGFPSAEQARASITQNSFLAGASYTQQFTSTLSNQSVAYGMFTELRNPAIRNYGRVTEPHLGGRTAFTLKEQFSGSHLQLSLGGEWQQGFATSTIYQNKNGNADSLQTEDDIRVRQSFVFLQSTFSFRTWELTAGASLNGSQLRFRRAFPVPQAEMRRNLNSQLAPRVALSRTVEKLTIYSSVSKGFSPPSATELLPTGSAINLDLQAEQGTNYDLGLRGNLLPGLTVDINAFYFRLKNTIVQRRDAGGGEYFINAGRTSQKGLETNLTYTFPGNGTFFRPGQVWLSHTFHRFRYKEFRQVSSDFSGKALPGVAPHTVAGGVDLMARNGLFANISYYFSSRLPLNDANADYAEAYHLLGAKIGWEKLFRNRQRLRFFVGADNLLDQRFSLGNDINAFGGRYFNAAARRNYYASLSVQLFAKRRESSLQESQ